MTTMLVWQSHLSRNITLILATLRLFHMLPYWPHHYLASITGGKFPAPWGVTVYLRDERIHTQEPQRDGADVPLGIYSELQKSGV
jgi:hypothetical protein